MTKTTTKENQYGQLQNLIVLTMYFCTAKKKKKNKHFNSLEIPPVYTCSSNFSIFTQLVDKGGGQAILG